LEIQELALIEISANNELSAMTENKIKNKKMLHFTRRLEENNVSTIWPVISGIAVSNKVAKTIIIDVKTNFPK